MKRILIIERSPEGISLDNIELINALNPDFWVEVISDNERCKLVRSNLYPEKNNLPSKWISIIDFFSKLCVIIDNDLLLFRLRNPPSPFPKEFFSEILDHFPEKSYSYVLSTANELGFDDFFFERFSSQFINVIKNDPMPIMPPGYFNGMAYPGCGRHYFSLSIRKLYLQDLFNELYGSPRYIAINTISSCNYHCIKCQYHSMDLKDPRKWPGPMSLETFRIFLEKCKIFPNLKSISPTISGEPFLHPNIVDIVRLIRKNNYLCSFSTNGSLLTPEMSKKIIDAGVGPLAFSIDSVNPEIYHQLQGGDLVTVEKNILSFKKEWEKQNNSFSGSVVFTVSDKNSGEMDHFREKWLNLGFNVIFTAEHDIKNNYSPFFIDNHLNPSFHIPCPAFWSGLYLNAEGDVMTCGMLHNSFTLNFFDTSPEILWHSTALSKIRMMQIRGKKPFFCKNSTCNTGQLFTWIFKDGRLLQCTPGTITEYPNRKQANNFLDKIKKRLNLKVII